MDKSVLEDLKPGEELTCYKCGAAQAVRYRWLKTPSGGKYKRGWCPDCLTGRGGNGAPKVAPFVRACPARPYPPGTEVSVSFEGKVLHYVPNKQGAEPHVVVLVGTAGYEVPVAVLEVLGARPESAKA